jgi:osmotically-inducible protein OsmY
MNHFAFRVNGTAAVIILFSIVFVSCKNSVKDDDIKAAIETAIKADPGAANMEVAVDNGVATIKGKCMNEEARNHCTRPVEKIKGVKSVVNNCILLPKMEIMPGYQDTLAK